MDAHALIFDFDGTLFDSMPMHFDCWQQALAPTALKFSEADFYAWGGMSSLGIVAKLAARASVDVDVEAVAAHKERLSGARALEAVAIEPVHAIARASRGKRPMAVATGGTRAAVLPVLVHHGMDGWFDALVTADDVTRGKPDPETFLLAAKQLSVAPADCLVFEDAPAGFEAARAAGMQVLDVRELRATSRS